jgi:energy-converting hydrogenase A subunit R
LRIFVSDCEGPISKNDNAFEIASYFLPEGDRLFSLLSRYDDVLADLVKRPGYQAGYTLKLIAPFLKAYGVTNQKIEEFSTMHILLVHRAKEMLQWVKGRMPRFIVSTSYAPYISSLCRLLDFPFPNAYCTKLDLDKYPIDSTEVSRLKALGGEISALPMIEIPKGTESVDQLSARALKTIRRLDRIFWETIPSMGVGQMLEEIQPIGGEQKADSIRDIVERVGCELDDVMYVGDSITDVKAFQLVRASGGLTISFNGNEYAVRNAAVAALSHDAVVIAVLADLFAKSGSGHVIKLLDDHTYDDLVRRCSDHRLQALFGVHPSTPPVVELVKRDNVDRLARESSAFRKTVRGEAIGGLG